MTAGALVNPDEGQVAIPWAQAPGGVAVGRLTARAIRWVETETDTPIDRIYDGLVRQVVAKGTVVPLSTATTVLWAGIENERRTNHRGHGRAWQVDDIDDLVDALGIEDAYNYALVLVQLSVPFRERTKKLEEDSARAGAPNPVDPLRAVAAGVGMTSSEAPTEPASPTPGA